MDDQQDPVIAEELETKEESPVEAPPEGETPEAVETPTEEPTPAEEPEAPAEEPEEPKISRREQLRVQDLLKKYPRSDVPSQTKPNFREKIAADEDTYKVIEETADQYARQESESVLAQADTRIWRRFLSMEEAQVKSKYPELDPRNTEKFHPALADAINTKYLRTIGYQPGDDKRPESISQDISYADFVEGEIEYADELASIRTTTTVNNIAKQVAHTGLRPDGSMARGLNLNQPAESMTTEELKAAIDQGLPRDSQGRFTSRTT